jgi:hypothetical protein
LGRKWSSTKRLRRARSICRPYVGLQFFGEVNIDRKTKAMQVDLKDIEGDVVFSQTLPVVGHSYKGSSHCGST